MATCLVVVAVVLASSFAEGWWPFSRTGSAEQTPPISYAQAAANASDFASSLGGGPWQVDDAQGAAFATGSTITLGDILLPLVCANGDGTYPAAIHASNTVTLPPDATNRSSGLAPFWAIWLVNPSRDFREVLVEGSHVSLLVDAPSSLGCTAGYPFIPPAVDSTDAVSAAWAAGASAFVANHTGSSVILTLGPAWGSSPQWALLWVSCTPPILYMSQPVTMEGSSALFYVNGTTGQVSDAFPPGTLWCIGP